MDQLDVAAGRFREPFKIFMVDCHDLVAVGRKQHDTSIDDVCKSGDAKELPSTNGTTMRISPRGAV